MSDQVFEKGEKVWAIVGSPRSSLYRCVEAIFVSGNKVRFGDNSYEEIIAPTALVGRVREDVAREFDLQLAQAVCEAASKYLEEQACLRAFSEQYLPAWLAAMQPSLHEITSMADRCDGLLQMEEVAAEARQRLSGAVKTRRDFHILHLDLFPIAQVGAAQPA